MMSPSHFKRIRNKIGLSQEAFGEKLGRSRAQISRYEGGIWPIPEHLSEYTMPLKIKGFNKLSTAIKKELEK